MELGGWNEPFTGHVYSPVILGEKMARKVIGARDSPHMYET